MRAACATLCLALLPTLLPEPGLGVRAAGAGPVPIADAPRRARAEAAESDALPLEEDVDQATLRLAVERALPAVARRARAPQASADARRAARSLELLREALARSDRGLAAEVRARLAARPAQAVFVTGYHEPLVEARRRRDERFRYPLYRPPAAATKPGRLPTRAQIEAGALEGQGLEIYWTDDPIELFFLHVQGSGRLQLEDGSIVRLAYAGNNGHRYRSIGQVLVARGVFRPEEATAPALKRYLREHPGEMWEIMRQNPRYIFFAGGEIEAPATAPTLGPVGSLGVPLVPYRSVAVDPKLVPLGSVGFLRVPLPDGTRFEAIVVAMDTGAAITGPERIDLFCGPGVEAGHMAGRLRHRGELAWLDPRD